MRTDLFDFPLPEDRIALRPVVPRDSARLLVVRPGAATPFEDSVMRDLPERLRDEDAVMCVRAHPGGESGRGGGKHKKSFPGDPARPPNRPRHARASDCGDIDP